MSGYGFRDALTGRVFTLVIGEDRATTGVRHNHINRCEALADVSPELDCAFCSVCQWQCRISGAWFMDKLDADGGRRGD